MAATMTIRLTSAGVDTSTVDIYTDSDGYTTPIASGISTAVLTGAFGLTGVGIPSGATSVRIQNVGVCDNYVDEAIVF
jgi:hypothetical protein